MCQPCLWRQCYTLLGTKWQRVGMFSWHHCNRVLGTKWQQTWSCFHNFQMSVSHKQDQDLSENRYVCVFFLYHSYQSGQWFFFRLLPLNWCFFNWAGLPFLRKGKTYHLFEINLLTHFKKGLHTQKCWPACVDAIQFLYMLFTASLSPKVLVSFLI